MRRRRPATSGTVVHDYRGSVVNIIVSHHSRLFLPQQRGRRAAHETILSVGRTETGRYDYFSRAVLKELVAEAVEATAR
jgi:hypothetical protein